jgi:ribulose-phosphate 3-epimerase
MKPILSASILSADLANLASEVKLCEEADVDWIHVDAMDGHFVPVLTMGPVIVEACRRVSSLPLDCHLMVEHPEVVIPAFVDAGATNITIHPENNPSISKSIDLLHSLGCQAGVALNPSTPVNTLHSLIEKIDLVLIMTVHPGYSGQAFMPEVIEKIFKTASLIKDSQREIRLEVDGGISPLTIKQTANAGADTFVSASAIFKSPLGIPAAVDALKSALK